MARIGDVITCSVKEAAPRGLIKKVMWFMRSSSDSGKKRAADGTYIRFDENAAVIIDEKVKEPKGTRIFGPVAREPGAKGFKIISSHRKCSNRA